LPPPPSSLFPYTTLFRSVRFHGRYEHHDLPALLAGLDVLVVPSLWWENSPLTVREGALAGLSVVVSQLGGLVEAVEEGLAIGFRDRKSTRLNSSHDQISY